MVFGYSWELSFLLWWWGAGVVLDVAGVAWITISMTAKVTEIKRTRIAIPPVAIKGVR